jgi:hypothetical protein
MSDGGKRGKGKRRQVKFRRKSIAMKESANGWSAEEDRLRKIERRWVPTAQELFGSNGS